MIDVVIIGVGLIVFSLGFLAGLVFGALAASLTPAQREELRGDEFVDEPADDVHPCEGR